MLYYINCLFLYSLLGFVLESTVFKIKKVNIHSGIFYGPITEVYGFGAIALILLKIYIIDKLSKIVKPDIAIITNIGSSHIGKLGSREEILNAKL